MSLIINYLIIEDGLIVSNMHWPLRTRPRDMYPYINGFDSCVVIFRKITEVKRIFNPKVGLFFKYGVGSIFTNLLENDLTSGELDEVTHAPIFLYINTYNIG